MLIQIRFCINWHQFVSDIILLTNEQQLGHYQNQKYGYWPDSFIFLRSRNKTIYLLFHDCISLTLNLLYDKVLHHFTVFLLTGV